MTSKNFISLLVANQLANLASLASKSASILCYQSPTKPHKRSVSKLDKSASQFESVGVSRS
ncbi:hypothetical protein ECB91_07875, partial [Helicobacter pylori]